MPKSFTRRCVQGAAGLVTASLLALAAPLAGSPAEAADVLDQLPYTGTSSPCRQVVLIGAQGSGGTYEDHRGLGPEVHMALGTYAQNLPGYDVGWFPVPYPAASADPVAQASPSYRKTFNASLDSGVREVLKFVSARNCPSEHYVLAGYSQGAMVMHRALWQLVNPSRASASTAAAVLPRVDAVLAVADGDRVANQGGVAYGTAPASGSGITWADSRGSFEYAPVKKRVPDLPAWPATRFHSVCQAKDPVCDYSANALAFFRHVHDEYRPDREAAVFVRSAAANAARTTASLQAPTNAPEELGTSHLRVGHASDLPLYGDYAEASATSVTLTSGDLPGATFHTREPTVPSYIHWNPTTAGTYPFSTQTTFADGHQIRSRGTIVVHSVPAGSLSISSVSTSYAPDRVSSSVAFDVTKGVESDTTPLRSVTSREDPASDYVSLTSGDTDGDGRLDTDETWHYEGVVDWGAWEPGDTRTRTLDLVANDTTGAPAFVETTTVVTLTR